MNGKSDVKVSEGGPCTYHYVSPQRAGSLDPTCPCCKYVVSYVRVTVDGRAYPVSSEVSVWTFCQAG